MSESNSEFLIKQVLPCIHLINMHLADIPNNDELRVIWQLSKQRLYYGSKLRCWLGHNFFLVIYHHLINQESDNTFAKEPK